MGKTHLSDLVVVLPGITGSVLQREGKDVWAVSGRALFSGIRSLGGSLGALQLPPHDPRRAPPDDGVKADRLIYGLHGVFGLGKIDGYAALVQLIQDNFEVEQGPAGTPSNFVEFPYDWRQSNRESARRLKTMIDDRLKLWREKRDKGAKVILVCHSMGGLVSRYYLEVLQGWRNCRALVTFGTPFRGAPEAVDYLANGYRKFGVELSAMTQLMRSCPSVYELMPRYKMLQMEGTLQRVGEVTGLPNINAELARAALEFHLEIDQAIGANQQDPARAEQGYLVLPFVGVHQPTIQSARVSDGVLTVSSELPLGVAAIFAGGDGTVPRLSATPVDQSRAFRETFLGERHSSLQNNPYLLGDFQERLAQLQATGLEAIRAEWSEEGPLKEQTAISLEIDEAYLPEEPVEVVARQVGENSSRAGFEAIIERADAPEAPRRVALLERSDGWELTLEGLPSGSYRLTVRPLQGGPAAPPAVHERFEIIPGELRGDL